MKTTDNMQPEKYTEEVKAKWSNTGAYAEYTEKCKDCTDNDYKNFSAGIGEVIKEFAAAMNTGFSADSEMAQHLVQKLQKYITDNFYTCTNEILASLGQMYVSDERFRNNIDKHTVGTAEYISDAISFYCS